jgi:Putative metal-binding motif
MFDPSINTVIMSKLNALAILFIGIVTLLLSSCGKSYSSGENSIPIDVYLYGPLRLSENEIEKNDSLAILLNLINGRVPQINFHRLDLGDSVFRDTVEMGFFNGLFEDLIDVNDMQEDLNNKVFGSDLKAFLTAPRGNEFKELDSMKTYLNIDSILLNRGASQSAILEKCFVKNSQMNNGRILISFLPSRQLIANGDGIPKPEDSTKDSDGDGFDSTNDCNDNDPKINPGTSEICNDSKDNNCDGKVDEGCSVSSGNTGPKLPFNVGLLCKDYSNSPSWNSIPGANKITVFLLLMEQLIHIVAEL